jgi:hypothetical protein
MIGLPFANRNSAELIEKMKYAKEHTGHANVSLVKAKKKKSIDKVDIRINWMEEWSIMKIYV